MLYFNDDFNIIYIVNNQTVSWKEYYYCMKTCEPFVIRKKLIINLNNLIHVCINLHVLFW